MVECFEEELRKALASLHDPEYTPSALLRALTGCADAADPCVRRAILQALDALKPTPDVPPTARARRLYEVLSYRYLQALTQETAAERLGITARHLRREQREAVLVLTRRLLERQELATLARPETALRTQDQPDEVLEWRDQVRQELAALQRSAPGGVADIGEGIRSAIALETARIARAGISLRLAGLPAGLIAAIHPSLLRQVLVTAIGQLAAHAFGGAISIEAGRSNDRLVMTLKAGPMLPGATLDTCLMQEILAAQDGLLEWSAGSDGLCLRLTLLPADEVTVLVVDDNADLVHFFERYTVGSRYHIVHMPLGRDVVTAVESLAPGVIVLDIMLPDVDGWELLAHLHENPVSRTVPVVVCSVIREEELALELGAAFYLPKPVRRGEFLQALDRAVAHLPELAGASSSDS